MNSTVKVRVTPKSSREEVVLDGELIKVYVRSAPADGEANEAVVRVLSKALRVPKSTVEIIKGFTSREKTINVDGLTTNECLERLTGSAGH